MSIEINERKNALELIKILEDDFDYDDMEPDVAGVFREIQRVLALQHNSLTDYAAAIHEGLSLNELFKTALKHVVNGCYIMIEVSNGSHVEMTQEEVDAIRRATGFMATFLENQQGITNNK